jgi:hypothetical protein
MDDGESPYGESLEGSPEDFAENDRQEDQEGEQPVLDPSDTLETDDLAADPLDTGVIPPDRWSPAERFGTTDEEEAEGESLDQLLSEEEPDLAPDDVDRPADTLRSGRLVAGDDPDGEELAESVGVDGGAASAEEAAMHDTADGEPPDDPYSGFG